MNEPQLVAFLLILTRVSAFVAFFTLFSFRQLPHLVKVAIGVGLSLFWYGQTESLAASFGESPVDAISATAMLVREFLIGVMLSIALNLFFLPSRIAGAYVGQELGLSLAAISSPAAPDSSTLITRVFEAFTVLIFFGLDMHHFLILTLDYSFNQLGGQIDVLALPTERLATMLNASSDYGLIIIGPMAVILLMITLGLALLNRAAPSLNLFSVGMSLRSGFGIFCVLMFLPVLFGALRAYLFRVQADIEQLLVSFH